MDISNESIYNLEWDLLKLEELGEFERGKSKHRPRHDSILFGGSYPFIQTGEIKAANYKITKFEKTYNEKGLSQSKLWSKNTLCITIAANIAETAILDIEACFPDSVVGFIPKLDNMDSYFMHYVFTYMRKKIQSSVSGSVQDNINIAYLKKLKFRVPKIEKRKKIVSVLKSLDDKIEINNAMNKTLEEMAQTLFKRWFIDFDFPNENGEPYKSSGGKMIDSELGEIPEGWEVGTLENIGLIVSGGTPSKSKNEYYSINGIPWITPKDLSINKNKFITRGALGITQEGLNKSSAKLLPKGTVLFSSRAPIGYLAIADINVSTNQGFKSIVPKNFENTEFIYQLLKDRTPYIESIAGGSTFKEISTQGMKSINIIIPPDSLLKKFYQITNSFNKRIQSLEKEIQSLTEIRDTLLPKLMSGEVEV